LSAVLRALLLMLASSMASALASNYCCARLRDDLVDLVEQQSSALARFQGFGDSLDARPFLAKDLLDLLLDTGHRCNCTITIMTEFAECIEGLRVIGGAREVTSKGIVKCNALADSQPAQPRPSLRFTLAREVCAPTSAVFVEQHDLNFKAECASDDDVRGLVYRDDIASETFWNGRGVGAPELGLSRISPPMRLVR
jgi:hypothetical protein